jgi:hypothetical protein
MILRAAAAIFAASFLSPRRHAASCQQLTLMMPFYAMPPYGSAMLRCCCDAAR